VPGAPPSVKASPAIWAVRMKRLGLSSVAQGFVGIGWRQLGDLSAIPPTREAFRAAYVAAQKGETDKAVQFKASELYRFVHEMQIGDVLVYPCGEAGLVHLGRVTGDYYHDPAGGDDPNRRTVEWLMAQPRAAFPPQVQKDFRGRATLMQPKGNREVYLGLIDQPTLADGTLAAELSGLGEPRLLGGQGYGLTAAERKLVENRAMEAARAWLEANGFTVIQDVSARAPCDFVATRDGVEHVIEVKGTTGGLGSIFLTRSEVALHQHRHPHNLLIVVHGIEWTADRASAVGGTLKAFDPWRINEAALVPMMFSYPVFGD
jgi:hypothetical protein